MTIKTITARTKSGKTVPVAVIPASMMTSISAEERQFEAVRLAASVGCGPQHWRIVREGGAIVQLPMLTRAQAAAVSGPSGEREGW